MHAKPMLMGESETLDTVGVIQWHNETFREAHNEDFKVILKQILEFERSERTINFEAYGLLFMRHETGNGIQLRARLQRANSVPLLTIHSDKIDDKFMHKLIKENIVITQPNKKRGPSVTRHNAR